MKQKNAPQKESFLKNHLDALAVIISIVSVNLAIGAIMISLWISNSSRIDSAHCRCDSLYETVEEKK